MPLLDGITNAYKLRTAVVNPTQLLLDPTNPRLITDTKQIRAYSNTELQDSKIQNQILDLVFKKEHDVRRLIESISEIGFVGGMHEMVVKPIGPNGPYKVLEGNRRTAAIRYLLKSPEKLREDVRRGLEQIEVKIFEYIPNTQHDEEKVISVLLGTIHIEGPREWGALEKANYITRTYSSIVKGNPFPFNNKAAHDVGIRFKQSTKAIHKALIICKTYEQIKLAHQDLSPTSYTLIDLATSTKAVCNDFFELDRDLCTLSELGVERFIELVLVPNAPVHNPKLFRLFVDIFKNGTANELEQIISKERSIQSVWDSLQLRKEKRAFRESLETLRDQINSLVIADFNGTESEKTLIRKIQQTVDAKLVPLLDV
jgi:hypothetical protein